ncbi:rhodanese-like domain-containing protein [Verrucomicrobiales bacterium]|jgi:rhodanese-related sulfurtransferase|nr:rhodanese-like domain-containing protein [Verrucomicrobiales bacterium]
MFPPTEDTEMTPNELQTLLSSNDSPVFRLIDCREIDEYAICRIEKAELIPLSRFAAEAPDKLIETEEPLPVVVYCHHGIRSMNATLFLRDKGLEKVWSLAGGIDLWSTQIDPEVPRY